MSKNVAVVGDVTATPGTVLHTKTAIGDGSKTAAGSWTADPVSFETYPGLVLNGKPAIWKAGCVFRFTGTNTSGSAVSETETVTLEAGTTALNPGQHSVLVDGDSTQSTVYQNTLDTSASGPAAN
ncbi:hypothetical protein [Ilumatobacter sp.]|uniref:hypothetical protein n=1 Tax=Ilumatobacter sp. TaxID=1967498 RepID=UPI003B522E66